VQVLVVAEQVAQGDWQAAHDDPVELGAYPVGQVVTHENDEGSK